jgi:hypothetical protein
VLLGVPRSTWLRTWLVDAAMGAINGDDEDLSVVPVVLVVLLIPEPFNLKAQHRSVTNQLEVVQALFAICSWFTT